MRLSEYTDYTLRVLMYCARHRQRLVTISELAEQHGLSKGHLMKVVNDLARQGLIETTRGRGGGLRLSKEPETIRIGRGAGGLEAVTGDLVDGGVGPSNDRSLPALVAVVAITQVVALVLLADTFRRSARRLRAG